jgi:S1-C subfamily serine protease
MATYEKQNQPQELLTRASIANATVHMENKDGQGVLIPGGFILTATHCINWSGKGEMVLNDNTFLTSITTKSGQRLLVSPVAADPLSDIAVLGAPDNQEFSDEADTFEEWCEKTEPVPVSMTVPRVRRPQPIGILSHTGDWIEGTLARFSNNGGSATIKTTADRILGGTSGGPVVDHQGRLLGVVSNGSEMGSVPLVCLALPHWVLMQVSRAQRQRRG